MNVLRESLDFSHPKPQDSKAGKSMLYGQKRSGVGIFVVLVGGAILLTVFGAMLPTVQKQVAAWRLSKERDGFNGVSFLHRDWVILDNDHSSVTYQIRNDSEDTYQVVTTECDVVWPNNLPAKRREVTDFAPGEVAKVKFVLKMAGDDIGFGTRIFADGKSVPTRSVAKRWLPWFLR